MVTEDVSVGKRGMDRKTWAETVEFKQELTPPRRIIKRKDLKKLAFIPMIGNLVMTKITKKKPRCRGFFRKKRVD